MREGQIKLLGLFERMMVWRKLIPSMIELILHRGM